MIDETAFLLEFIDDETYSTIEQNKIEKEKELAQR